jgi:hypothetical protein
VPVQRLFDDTFSATQNSLFSQLIFSMAVFAFVVSGNGER